jgi:Ca2+-binding EF-hand superfamily protein
LDKSGTISASELRNVLKKLDIPAVENEVKSLMKSMDRNGDGTIQFSEFAKTMGGTYYAEKSKEDIVAAFRKYDTDNSGQITADELYQVMKDFRGTVTRQECQKMVNGVDKDKNGKINLLEFISLLS